MTKTFVEIPNGVRYEFDTSEFIVDNLGNLIIQGNTGQYVRGPIGAFSPAEWKRVWLEEEEPKKESTEG